MKLYVTTNQPQAFKALNDFRGQRVSLIGDIIIKGVLRLEKIHNRFYVKRGKEKIFIHPVNVVMIAQDDNEIRILIK